MTTFDHIPASYQPTAIRQQGAAIGDYMVSLGQSDRPKAEKEAVKAQYTADLEAKEDRYAVQLLGTVIEQGGDPAQVGKARLMILVARQVLHSELPHLAANPSQAGERLAIVSLGLQYFTEQPTAFRNALATDPSAAQRDFASIQQLLAKPDLMRRDYRKILPAPAALAALGALNALELTLATNARYPDSADIGYYLVAAAAWNQVGNNLLSADPELLASALPTNRRPDQVPWPPPWLEFLNDIDTK